jgi:hypothetical protein
VIAISQEKPVDETTPAKINFRWIYIVPPVVLLVLAIIIAAAFYHALPDSVAYQLRDNTPLKTLSRSAAILWLIIPQVVCSVIAFGIVRIVLTASRYWEADDIIIKKVVSVMGNMIVLPQGVFFFALLDIILYNAYQTPLVPIWIIALIILVVGGVFLGIFFFLTIRQFRRLYGKRLKE